VQDEPVIHQAQREQEEQEAHPVERIAGGDQEAGGAMVGVGSQRSQDHRNDDGHHRRDEPSAIGGGRRWFTGYQDVCEPHPHHNGQDSSEHGKHSDDQHRRRAGNQSGTDHRRHDRQNQQAARQGGVHGALHRVPEVGQGSAGVPDPTDHVAPEEDDAEDVSETGQGRPQ